MENKELYYEVKATRASEVEDAYEYAKTHNIKFYRAITESGKIFGWQDEHHVAASDGRDWFENPFYEESEEKEESIAGSADTLELSADEQSISQTVNSEVPDMDNLFEKDARIAELEKLVAEKSEILETVEKQFAELKHAAKVIIEFIKGA